MCRGQLTDSSRFVYTVEPNLNGACEYKEEGKSVGIGDGASLALEVVFGWPMAVRLMGNS